MQLSPVCILPGDPIQVHLTRVAPCPPHLPVGFYWCGPKRKSPDSPPKWVEALMCAEQPTTPSTAELPHGGSCQSSHETPVASCLGDGDARPDEGTRAILHGDVNVDPEGVLDSSQQEDTVDTEDLPLREDQLEGVDPTGTGPDCHAKGATVADRKDAVQCGGGHPAERRGGYPKRTSRWMLPGGGKQYPLRSQRKQARGRASPEGGVM